MDVSAPVSELTEMASYAYYTGEIDSAAWLLNEGMANVFRAFLTYDKKVSLTFLSWTQFSETLPLDVSLRVHTGAAPNWSKVELFDYDQLLATVLAPSTPITFVDINTTFRRKGVHGLFALVTEADGATFWTTDVALFIAAPEPNGPVLLGLGILGLCVWRGLLKMAVGSGRR